MTLSDRDLADVFRVLAREAIKEGQSRARVPRVLSGTVEDVSEDLNIVYVRMDAEAMGRDPLQSMNYGNPGVIPVTRLGSTYTNEVVRVDFDGSNGASAMQTSVENRIVIPYGKFSGQRVEIDGNQGAILFYDDFDEVVGYLDPNQWFVGGIEGLQARLDPIGGLRLRDDDGEARSTLSATEGLILRDPVSGISGAILTSSGLTVIDPVTGDRVSITSGSVSSVPIPNYSGASAHIGATHGAPAVASFGTGDDLDIRFASASALAPLGAQTWTPPSGFTERSDQNNSASISLATSVATKDPSDAAPAIANFTSTTTNFDRSNTHSVIVRGGGGTSPSYASINANPVIDFGGQQLVFDITAPSGVVSGDLILAHVAIASLNVPVGWTVPDGWTQLGIQVEGLGTNHVHGSGLWYKRAGPSEPTSESVAINMTAPGHTRIQATTIRISNPFVFPAGLDIRRNNRSMPRGLVGEVVSAANTPTWNAVDLPQVIDTIPTSIKVQAGRKYRVQYVCPIYDLATLSATSRWYVAIEINENAGGGWVEFHRTFYRGLHSAGTEYNSLNGGRFYTPTADRTVDVRTRAIMESGSPTTFTIRFHGLGTWTRSLTVEDAGAVF